MRLLVVDPYRDGADSLAMLRSLWEHDARACYDAEGVLHEADDFRPHAIFTEIVLPGMHGLELAARLREAGNRAMLIALTGFGGEEIRRRAQEAGYARFIVKPAEPDQLLEVLAFVRFRSAQMVNS